MIKHKRNDLLRVPLGFTLKFIKSYKRIESYHFQFFILQKPPTALSTIKGFIPTSRKFMHHYIISHNNMNPRSAHWLKMYCNYRKGRKAKWGAPRKLVLFGYRCIVAQTDLSEMSFINFYVCYEWNETKHFFKHASVLFFYVIETISQRWWWHNKENVFKVICVKARNLWETRFGIGNFWWVTRVEIIVIPFLLIVYQFLK